MKGGRLVFMALFRCGSGSAGAGYNYLKTASLTVSSKKATITGLTAGKEYYLILAYGWTNTNFSAELSSISGGSNLTKIESATEKTAQSLTAAIVQSVYTFTATGTSAEMTFSSVSTSYSFVCRAFLFESV